MGSILWSAQIGAVIAVLALPDRGHPAPKPKDKAEVLGAITAEQLAESAKNLEQIALAFHNYHDTYGQLPINQLSKDKKPLLSWRVQILAFIERAGPLAPPGTPPVIEHEHLFKAFKLDEPWDSEHNRKLIDKMPRLYAPVRGKADPGLTFYQALGGLNRWLRPGARLAASFPDGTSNTFLVAEAARPVVWTKPDDLAYDGKNVPVLGGMFEGKFHAAMADGSVSRFRKTIDADVLKLQIDPADGKVLPADFGIDPEKTK